MNHVLKSFFLLKSDVYLSRLGLSSTSQQEMGFGCILHTRDSPDSRSVVDSINKNIDMTGFCDFDLFCTCGANSAVKKFDAQTNNA